MKILTINMDYCLFGALKVYLKGPSTWDKAVRIFVDPTEASIGKKTEASDWSNLHFEEPPAFSNITDANMVGEMFSCMRESVLLVNFDFKKNTC